MAIERVANIPKYAADAGDIYDKGWKALTRGLSAQESGFAKHLPLEGDFLGKTMPDIHRGGMHRSFADDQDAFDPTTVRARKKPRVGMPFSEDEFQPRPDYNRKRRPTPGF